MTDTRICIGGFNNLNKTKSLSIIILFCDKDYQYIPSILSNIHTKVFCAYELIMVDNREKTKDIDIPEITEFFKTHEGMYLTQGKNICQLSAKKWAFEFAKSDYVWFIDGDDDICDVVSDSMLNSCKGDIIAFNYVYNNESEHKIIFQERFYKNRILRNKRIFRTDEYLEHSCVTCWNKWFSKKLLDKIFKNIPDHLKVSCNEDVYICCAALNNAHTIEERNNFIYVNNPHRGISNNRIDSIEKFKMIIQGWEDSMCLFRIEFPLDTKLFNYKNKRLNDVRYFINRMYNSDRNIWGQEIEFIKKIFTKDEILSMTDIFEYEGHNTSLSRNDKLLEELKSFIKTSF